MIPIKPNNKTPACVLDLNKRQDLFCRGVAASGKYQKSAIAAGYSVNSAHTQASKLLKKPKIKKAIEYYSQEVHQRLNINSDMVLQGIHRNAVRCQQGEPVLDTEGNEVGVWRFDASGSNRAWELLGKHLRMFVDRIETADVTAAKDHVEKIMIAVFGVVTDPDTQQDIIKAIEDIEAGSDGQ